MAHKCWIQPIAEDGVNVRRYANGWGETRSRAQVQKHREF